MTVKSFSNKKSSAFTVATVLVISIVIPLLFSVPVAEATDFALLRSWVNVEIPYYGTDNILVKMTAITIGNRLSHGMWIDEITTGSSNTEKGNITFGFSLSVVVGRAVIEAEYSADSNMTKFTYTVSSSQYRIAPSGVFPYDYWRIGIIFHTNFTAEFDPRMKYCLTPSPNYYGRYNTTYGYTDAQGYNYYSLNLEILHPPTFPTYVFSVFLPPVILLGILALFCTIFLVAERRHINQIENMYIAICAAVIVFIPIFQLSTQELKTPFTLTWVDWLFIILLAWYILILVGIIVGKYLNARREKVIAEPTELIGIQKARK